MFCAADAWVRRGARVTEAWCLRADARNGRLGAELGLHVSCDGSHIVGRAPMIHARPNVDMKADSLTNTGGSKAFSIRNPYLGVNHIIAMQGIFPSRN